MKLIFFIKFICLKTLFSDIELYFEIFKEEHKFTDLLPEKDIYYIYSDINKINFIYFKIEQEYYFYDVFDKVYKNIKYTDLLDIYNKTIFKAEKKFFYNKKK